MIELNNGQRAAVVRLTRRFLRRLELERRRHPTNDDILNGLIDVALASSFGEEDGDRTLRTDVIAELHELGLVEVRQPRDCDRCVQVTALGLGYGMAEMSWAVDRPAHEETLARVDLLETAIGNVLNLQHDGTAREYLAAVIDGTGDLLRGAHHEALAELEQLRAVACVAQVVVDEMIDIGPHGSDLVAALEALGTPKTATAAEATAEVQGVPGEDHGKKDDSKSSTDGGGEQVVTPARLADEIDELALKVSPVMGNTLADVAAKLRRCGGQGSQGGGRPAKVPTATCANCSETKELVCCADCHVALGSELEAAEVRADDFEKRNGQGWAEAGKYQDEAARLRRELAATRTRADKRLTDSLAVVAESTVAGMARGIGEGIAGLTTPSE